MHVRDFGNCGVPCFNVGAADDCSSSRHGEGGAGGESGRAADPAHAGFKDVDRPDRPEVIGVVPGKSGVENIIVNATRRRVVSLRGDGLAVETDRIGKTLRESGEHARKDAGLCASGGHHSTGLNGPANLVRMNPALTGKTVLVVNLEAHLAVTSALRRGARNRPSSR